MCFVVVDCVSQLAALRPKLQAELRKAFDENDSEAGWVPCARKALKAQRLLMETAPTDPTLNDLRITTVGFTEIL